MIKTFGFGYVAAKPSVLTISSVLFNIFILLQGDNSIVFVVVDNIPFAWLKRFAQSFEFVENL